MKTFIIYTPKGTLNLIAETIDDALKEYTKLTGEEDAFLVEEVKKQITKD